MVYVTLMLNFELIELVVGNVCWIICLNGLVKLKGLKLNLRTTTPRTALVGSC